MKKKLVSIFLGCLIYSNLYSGGGIESFNLQTPYMLGNSANQSKVSVDTIFSNPAGIVFLEEGEYLMLGTLIIQPDYRNEVNKLTATTTTPQGAPSFSYVSVKNNTGLYFGMGLIGQGGILKYNLSTDFIKNIKVKLIHPGGIFGIAKKFNNTSFGIGGRFIYSLIKTEGTLSVGSVNDRAFKSQIEAWGITPEFSIHHRVNDQIDLSLKYQWKINLDYDGKVKKGNTYLLNSILPKYSMDQKKDFPATLSLGGSYKADTKNMFFLGYNWIFESDKSADYDSNYDDIYEYSVGYERKITEKSSMILSYTYSDRNSGTKKITSITDLDSHHIGVGLEYKKSSTLSIICSTGVVLYDKVTSTFAKNLVISSERREFVLGIGFTKKFK